MKNKYWDPAVLAAAAAIIMFISMLCASIPALRQISEGVFNIGVPFAFLRVYSTASGFSAHLAIGSLAADIAAAYVICMLIKTLIKK